jgi:hypothetical protein
VAATKLDDRVKKAEKSLQKLKQPDGSREYPALSCKDIKACYPGKEDGYYYIDPNEGCSADAFRVYCNFTAGNLTCLTPKDVQDENNNAGCAKRKYSYDGGKVQLRFLKLLSGHVIQKLTYECCNAAAVNDSLVASTLDEEAQCQQKFVSYSGTEVSNPAQYRQPHLQESPCSNSYAFRDLETLPILEFTPSTSCANRRLTANLGAVCFA